jgi:hypothetical protein
LRQMGIGAEASGDTDIAVYTVAGYDQDAVTRMLAAAMTGDLRAALLVSATARGSGTGNAVIGSKVQPVTALCRLTQPAPSAGETDMRA